MYHGLVPKPLKAQLTLDSLLEPDVKLDSRVVTTDDPRWPQVLQDLANVAKTKRFVGIDLEYFSSSVATGGDQDGDEDDPWTTTIRLVQVAVGSVCLVADFGGVCDDRTAAARRYGDTGEADTYTFDGETVTVPRFTPGSFLDILRNVCEDRAVVKGLQNAKGDVLRLRIAWGIRTRNIRCSMLASQLYWAGVKGIRHGLGFITERAVQANALGVWLVEKRLQRSEWRWKLSNAQINYAATDALVMWPLLRWLLTLLKDAGMQAAAEAEFGAIAPFVEFEYHGLPVNPAMLDDHIRMWKRGRELAIAPFRRRYPGVNPSQPQVVAVALTKDDCYGGHVFYELDETKPRRRPVWILGERFDYGFRKKNDRYSEAEDHSVSEAVLSKFNNLPWISALLDWRSMGVVIKWMENVQKRLRRDGRVRAEYRQIAGGESRSGDDNSTGAGMGRSAASRPSLQQSANPQPKLSTLIHKAMGWQGDIVAMSPRLPFVPHDAYAAAYLRWAAARLRGDVADPFAVSTAPSVTAAPSVVVGDLDEDETDADDYQVFTDAELTARWYDELATQWESRPGSFLVADFSQAHMRIAAQASQDQQLCEDFRLDRDAHLKLAYDFGVATGQIPADLPIEAFFAWYDKKHPKHKFVKSLRQPAKTGNYTCLNLGSTARLKGAGDTAKPPIHLTYDEWALDRDAWRRRYVGLATYQRQHIDACNSIDVVIDGYHYGAAWALTSGRRLWLRKEANKYDRSEPKHCRSCGKTHGSLTVRGTDAVALRWMGTEADAIKWALARILEECDQHDAYWMARGHVAPSTVWGARLGSMAHDELDATARRQCAVEVAACIRKWFAAGLRWSGVVDVPVEPADAKDTDLIVKCWADK